MAYIWGCIQNWHHSTRNGHTVEVEPLSNDHPHQRPSLLYDHILCDGHCFCLCDPWPTPIPQTRPTTGSDGIFSLANDHLAYSVDLYFQESRVAVQHPFPMVYYYNVLPIHLSSNSLIWTLFWRRFYNHILRSTLHRYDVDSLPALRHICSMPNSSALN